MSCHFETVTSKADKIYSWRCLLLHMITKKSLCTIRLKADAPLAQDKNMSFVGGILVRQYHVLSVSSASLRKTLCYLSELLGINWSFTSLLPYDRTDRIVRFNSEQSVSCERRNWPFGQNKCCSTEKGHPLQKVKPLYLKREKQNVLWFTGQSPIPVCPRECKKWERLKN